MSTKDDALTVFFARVARLNQLFGDYGLLSKARGIPDDRVRAVNALRINVDGYSRMTPELEAIAQRAFAHMKAEERSAGSRERDTLLAEYAAELESLRAILPSLAAKASIELGVIARSIANQEQPQ